MARVSLSGLRWRKSGRSTSQPNCVEVAFADQAVAARDSKHREGAVLAFSRADWSSFLDAVREQRFDG